MASGLISPAGDVGFVGEDLCEASHVRELQLREKLRKIEALFAGAGTAGERLAAEAALERVRARLSELGRQIRRSRCNSRCPTSGPAICLLPCAGAMA